MHAVADDSASFYSNVRDAETVGYAEAATLLGMKISTLYCWVHAHRVPHYRMSRRCVRFRRSELLAWLEAHAVRAVGQASPDSMSTK